MTRLALALALLIAMLGPGIGTSPAVTEAQSCDYLPGTPVQLAGTPHLFIVDDAGVLHWGGDTRALAGKTINWGSLCSVGLAELLQTPRGDPWLSAGLPKIGDPIFLAKWEDTDPAPTLLHIQSIADVELFGINTGNYGNFVLDRGPWEQRFGFNVSTLKVGPLASAASFAFSDADKASYAQLLTDIQSAQTLAYGRLSSSGTDPATSLPNIINCEKQALSIFDQGHNSAAALQSAQGCLSALTPGLPVVTATPPPSTGIPPMPTGLRVFATSPTDIQVMWDPQAGPVNGYRIYGGDQNAPSTGLVTTVAANLSSQLISGRSSGVIYCYAVSAFNGLGESPRTTPVCASTSGVVAAPAAPVRLTVAAASSNGLRLDWTDQSTNEDGFQIMRNDTLIATVNANIQTYTDFSWNPSGPNCYRVVAYNSTGSASSDQACPSGPSPTSPPSAPNNLQVLNAQLTSVTLTWGDTSGNEDGFYIYEGNNTVGTVGPNTTTWAATAWDSSARHCYEVAAYNAFGQSARSNSVCAGPITPPATPTPSVAPTTLPAPITQGTNLTGSHQPTTA